MSCLTPFLHLLCCLLPATMSTPVCLTWLQGTGKWNLVLSRSCTTCKISNFSINRHLTSIISNPPHLKMRGTGPTHSFCLVQGTPGQVSTTKTLHLTNGAVFARTQQQPQDERLCSFAEGIPTRKRSRYCHYFRWTSVSILSAEFQLKTNKLNHGTIDFNWIFSKHTLSTMYLHKTMLRK